MSLRGLRPIAIDLIKPKTLKLEERPFWLLEGIFLPFPTINKEQSALLLDREAQAESADHSSERLDFATRHSGAVTNCIETEYQDIK